MIGTSTATPVLAIAIVSSNCLVRLGLRTILENKEIGRSVQMHQRMTPDVLLAERRPDVFVLDLETVRGVSGIINEIRESAPGRKIVLLCGFEDKGRACEEVALGVDGVILTVQPPEVVLATIEALYASIPHCARGNREGAVGGSFGIVASLVVDSATQLPAWPDTVTEREEEVISLVLEGLTNKEIAHRLCIADSTVRYHLTNIFDKIGVPSRQKLLVHTHRFRSTSTSSP